MLTTTTRPATVRPGTPAPPPVDTAAMRRHAALHSDSRDMLNAAADEIDRHRRIPDPGPSFGDVLVVEEKQKRIGTLLRAAADEHDLIALNYLTDAIDLALNLLHVRWDREANEIIPTPGSKYQPLED